MIFSLPTRRRTVTRSGKSQKHGMDIAETHIVLANVDTVCIDSKGNIDSIIDDQRYPMSAGDFKQPSSSLDEVGGRERLLAQLDDGDAAEDELLDMIFERRCRRRKQIGIGDEVQRVVDCAPQRGPHCLQVL